jgi:hypothetical protein
MRNIRLTEHQMSYALKQAETATPFAEGHPQYEALQSRPYFLQIKCLMNSQIHYKIAEFAANFLPLKLHSQESILYFSLLSISSLPDSEPDLFNFSAISFIISKI